MRDIKMVVKKMTVKMKQCPKCGGSGQNANKIVEFLEGQNVLCKTCKGHGFIPEFKTWKERFFVHICKNCGATICIKEGLSDIFKLKIALDELMPCCKDPNIYDSEINLTNTIWLESEGEGYDVKHHIKALTYAPKIKGVLDGDIKQTIRPLWKIHRGDTILFHGWKDRPYHSKWTWRILVKVSRVENIHMFSDGILVEGIFFKWSELNILAEKDGIEKIDNKGYGESMGMLFNEMYDLLPSSNINDGKTMQEIIWDEYIIIRK